MKAKNSKKRFFPNTLTILNMFLGFSSIILIMNDSFIEAGVLILLAGLMDIFDGKFKSVKYIKGDFLAAFDHKASDQNERTEITIETKFGSMLVKQIAGLVARRILCYANENEIMSAGDRLGFIRFGSRTDIILPESIDIKIELNQKVYGGETIIGTYEN